jgi:hypothetical protein
MCTFSEYIEKFVYFEGKKKLLEVGQLPRAELE